MHHYPTALRPSRTTTRTPLVGATAIRTHARDAPAGLHGRWLGMRVCPNQASLNQGDTKGLA